MDTENTLGADIRAASPKKLQNRIIGYAIKPYVIEGDSDDGNDDHDLLRCIIKRMGQVPA